VVIVSYLDLQLPIQSVPITAKVVSSNPVHREVYSKQHYVIKFVSDSVSLSQGIIRLVVSVSVLTWFTRYILHFLNNVIIIKTTGYLPQV
jgi:hypothetical protein